MIPTLGASLIATSRIMDARHHPFDVISGSLLGILVAWGSYRQYFPAVTDSWRKGRAYPIRSWGTEPMAPTDNTGFTRINESAEPIRAPDEEERSGIAGGISGGGNGGVFRQPSSNYPVRGRSMSPIPLGNPFTTASIPYTHHPNVRDGNWSSSSSEDGDGPSGYNMTTYGRPGAASAAEAGGIPSSHMPGYDQVDTGYHPQAPVPLAVSGRSYGMDEGADLGSTPQLQPQQQDLDRSTFNHSPVEGEGLGNVTHPLRTA
jgi:diacylglycerol diphosphate phosphatase/phosphatidate phosphatase